MKNAQCDCHKLPEYTNYDGARGIGQPQATHGISQRLSAFLKPVAQGRKNRELFQCRVCNTHWRIQAPSGVGFVWKVGVYREGWDELDFPDKEKALLLQRRGGETLEECAKAGCHQRRLMESAYCLDHTYADGVWR